MTPNEEELVRHGRLVAMREPLGLGVGATVRLVEQLNGGVVEYRDYEIIGIRRPGTGVTVGIVPDTARSVTIRRG